MSTYVMSDIHGQYDKFLRMLELIEFSDSDKLYILGDICDRGSDSIKCLLHVMKEKNITMLLGNHEKFLLEFYANDERNGDLWFYNGGRTTYEELKTHTQQTEIEILAYLMRLSLVGTVKIGDKTFILCHAGVELDEEGQIKLEQDEDFLLWSRNEFLNQDFSKVGDNIQVIFGHTPTVGMNINAPLEKSVIWKNDHKIGIDCGVVFGGRLACLRLDDMKEFYIGNEKTPLITDEK